MRPFNIAACRANIFKRTYIHVLWRLHLTLPPGWFPLALLPWIGCYAYAEDRECGGYEGCLVCTPVPPSTAE